jgi:hypothetical protein
MILAKEGKQDLTEKIDDINCKPFIMKKSVIYYIHSYKTGKFLRLIRVRVRDFPIPFAMGEEEYGPYCYASKNLSKKQAVKICPRINLKERKKGNTNYYFGCNNLKYKDLKLYE